MRILRTFCFDDTSALVSHLSTFVQKLITNFWTHNRLGGSRARSRAIAALRAPRRQAIKRSFKNTDGHRGHDSGRRRAVRPRGSHRQGELRHGLPREPRRRRTGRGEGRRARSSRRRARGRAERDRGAQVRRGLPAPRALPRLRRARAKRLAYVRAFSGAERACGLSEEGGTTRAAPPRRLPAGYSVERSRHRRGCRVDSPRTISSSSPRGRRKKKPARSWKQAREVWKQAANNAGTRIVRRRRRARADGDAAGRADRATEKPQATSSRRSCGS